MPHAVNEEPRDESTNDLSEDVSHRLANREALEDRETYSNGRIEVASGYGGGGDDSECNTWTG